MHDKLSQDAITSKVAELGNGWKFDEQDIAIEKEFVLKDFLGAVAFIEKIAPVAQAMDHHPDLLLHDYKRVRVILSTHSAGGITENDFALAHSIEQIK